MEGYERIDNLTMMRLHLKNKDVLKKVELDKSTGFCVVTFDTESKYKEIKELIGDSDSGVIVEKIFNINQINYYLSSEFECTVVDLGIEKRRTKNGYKNFFYVKFLYDEKLKIPKDNWNTNTR